MQPASRTRQPLTEGPIGKRLFLMTVPMVFGMVSMVAFNLTDTYFVGQLGTQQLAAMGFTFPVIFLLNSFSMGLAQGASSTVSRAIGAGDHHRSRRLTTDTLVLAVLSSGTLAVVGLSTIDPIFRLLGASDEVLPLVREYMLVWYSGMAFFIVPMIGNHAIRAAGDTKLPSIIMAVAAGTNIVLDPLLIWGAGPIPAMGLRGAAVATVISRALTVVVSCLVLHYRERLLVFARPRFAEVWRSWKSVLHIGVPAAGTHMLLPISAGLVTRMVAGYGDEAVAAAAAGGRVEIIALMIVFALGSTMMPFLGQNWGARRFDRVHRVQNISIAFVFGWGLLCLGVFELAAPVIAPLFSDDPEVVGHLTWYLRITPVAFGLRSVVILVTASLNAIGKPLRSTALMFVRMFVLYVPLGYLGSRLLGLYGLFGGVTLGNALAGLVAWWALRWIQRGMEATETRAPERSDDESAREAAPNEPAVASCSQPVGAMDSAE